MKRITGDAVLVIHDNALVDVVKGLRSANLSMGEEVGVISYNESALKEVIGNGMSAISTDFHAMGEMMAELIQSGREAHITIPTRLLIRPSL